MTTKEKIETINRAMNYLFTLYERRLFSDDEMLYLYDLFWQARWRVESCVEVKGGKGK